MNDKRREEAGDDSGHPVLGTLLEEALRVLDTEGIAWAWLNDSLPAGGSDAVTVLVGQRDRRRVEALLRPVGLARLRTIGAGKCSSLIGYDSADGSWRRIDFVSVLILGAAFDQQVAIATSFLARRMADAFPPVPAPSDAFWMLLFRSVLDPKGIAPEGRLRLKSFAPHADTENELARLMTSRSGSAIDPRRLVDDCLHSRWNELEELRAVLAQSLLSGHRSIAVAAGKLHKAVGPGHRVGLKGRGICVALLGPDGAGKSTLAGRFVQASAPAKAVYLGLYRPTRSDRFPVIALTLRLLKAWRGGLSGYVHARLGRLVIFDRYTYDALTAPFDTLPRLWLVHHRLIARALPEPDLVVILDAPGSVMYARKREESALVLERQRRVYLQLAAARPSFVVLDATRPVDELERDLSAVAWATYLRRSAKPEALGNQLRLQPGVDLEENR